MNRNIIIGVIVAILIAIAALVLGIICIVHEGHTSYSHGGGCCCCGGGGMSGGSNGGANTLIAGGNRSGNPSTVIMAQSGVININITPANPQTATVLSISFSSPTTGARLMLHRNGITPALPDEPITAGTLSRMFSYSGAPTVWTLTPMTPITNNLAVNQPWGPGQSDFSGTYSFMDGANASSATVTINSY